jgi:O-antigen/teichoic acid export membrane protein
MTNSASGLAERFVNLFVQLWLYQYLIKRISPEEYSLYPVVTALLVFVPPFLVVVTAGLVRGTVEAHTRKDEQRITEIASTLFPVLLVTSAGLAVLAIVLARYLGSVLNIAAEDLPEARLMVFLLFGSLALRVVLLPFSVGLYVRQKFVATNTLTIVQTLVRVVLLFVLLFGAGTRVLWIVVATVAADVATVLTTTILSVQSLPALRFRPSSIRWELFSGLVSFGFWNMIGSIGAVIRKSSDLLILNHFATPVDVNTFQLASLTDNQIDAALTKMKEPLLPHMVALHTSGGAIALRALYTRGGSYCLWAALFVATPLIAFRQPLWSLYLGPKLAVYADVPVVTVLLLVRYWIEMPVYLIGQAAYAMSRMQMLSILVIASSVSNVATTLYFVHVLHMGAVGSALGTLVSVVVWSLFVTWKYSLSLLGLEFWPWFRAAVLRGVLPSGVAGLFALAWNYWIGPETVADLVVAVALVVTVYLATIVLFCLDESERGRLKQLFARPSSQRGMPASSAES